MIFSKAIQSVLFGFVIVSAPSVAARSKKSKKSGVKPNEGKIQIDLVTLRGPERFGESTNLDNMIDISFGLGIDQKPNLVGGIITIANPVMRPEDAPIVDGVIGDVDLRKRIGTMKTSCTITGVSQGATDGFRDSILENFICDLYICLDDDGDGTDDCIYAKTAATNARIGLSGLNPELNRLRPKTSGIVLGGTGDFADVTSGQVILEELTNARLVNEETGRFNPFFYTELTLIVPEKGFPIVEADEKRVPYSRVSQMAAL